MQLVLKSGSFRVGKHKKVTATPRGRHHFEDYTYVLPRYSLTSSGQLTIPFPVLLFLFLTTLLFSLLFALLTLAFLTEAVFFSSQVINTSFRDRLVPA